MFDGATNGWDQAIHESTTTTNEIYTCLASRDKEMFTLLLEDIQLEVAVRSSQLIFTLIINL